MTDKDKPPELPPVPPVLAMDGIRIATLVMLGVHTVAVVVLTMLLVTNERDQAATNQCYQRQNDELTAWATAAVQAGRSDRQAQRELLLARLGGADERVAVERYLVKLDEADRTRSFAPVPPQRCIR